MHVRALLVTLIFDGVHGQMWTINSGAAFCTLSADGTCITDGVGTYGNNEECVATANQDVTVTSTEFNTESGFDYVYLTASPGASSVSFAGSTGPSGIAMTAGGTFRWRSDGGVTAPGFTVCGYLPPPSAPNPPTNPPMTPQPTSPPSLPPLAPPPLAPDAHLWEITSMSTGTVGG